MDKEKIKKILLPFGLLAASFAVFALLLALRPVVPSVIPTERVWNVNVVRAEVKDIQPTLKVFGEVVAGRKITLRALVSGEINEMHPQFREGGIVEKDDKLFQIDPFNYERAVEEALARLSETQAKLDEFVAQRQQETDGLKWAEEQAVLSKRDLERAKKLMRRGHISEKTMDDKKLAYSLQQQSVEMRRNNLAIQNARIAQQEGAIVRGGITLTQAERELSRTLLRAPFRGFLSQINAAVGRLVNVNDPIAELIDADQLEVRFHLSDAQFGRIISSTGGLKGNEVKITWTVGKKTFSFSGTIIRIGAQISQAAGGVSIFANIIVDDFNSTLRPGAFVQIHLDDRAYTQVVRLPTGALYAGNRIYVIEKERLVPREVTVLGQIGDDFLIQGAIQKGDIVLTTWFAEAGPGTKVFAIEPKK